MGERGGGREDEGGGREEREKGRRGMSGGQTGSGHFKILSVVQNGASACYE